MSDENNEQNCYLCNTYKKLIDDFPKSKNLRMEYERHKEVSGHGKNE